MANPITIEGGCLCGAVRYRAEEPLWVAHCHCRECRRASGAAFATYVGLASQNLVYLSGEPASFASSPGVQRGFCARCGSSLSYQSERWPGEIHIFAATADAPEGLEPQGHVYCAEKLPWIELDDGLPQHQTTPNAD
jgi:hypothetical protein